jgi:hypothetical protein
MVDSSDVETMPLLARGNVKDDVCTQGAKALQEEGGSGLSVGIEVTPYGNPLTSGDRLAQTFDSNGQAW